MLLGRTIRARERACARSVLQGSFKAASARLRVCRVQQGPFVAEVGWRLRRRAVRVCTASMLVLLRACRADWVSFNLEGDRRLAMRVLLESTAMRRDCRARRAVVRQARILQEERFLTVVLHVWLDFSAMHLACRFLLFVPLDFSLLLVLQRALAARWALFLFRMAAVLACFVLLVFIARILL